MLAGMDIHKYWDLLKKTATVSDECLGVTSFYSVLMDIYKYMTSDEY